MTRFPAATSLLVALTVAAASAAAWKPAAGPLMTRWAQEVSPKNAHPEYPRPQMVRADWQNLNGLWEYVIVPREAAPPKEFDGQILVPFPVESALSGVMEQVGEANRLWYRRSFRASKPTAGGRLLLHFDAVDWHATVWVNGNKLGEHKGGYDPFTFDVTDALRATGQQEIILSVWDPSNAGSQPRGKQVVEPKGIWYTPVTGIWQTVWLEPVPAASIASLKATPDVDAGLLRLRVEGRGTSPGDKVKAVARDGDAVVATAAGTVGEQLGLKIADAKLWSPDTPFLYDLEVTLQRDGKPLDRVTSYFGMRKIAVARAKDGHNRLMLNGEPLFQFGPLDQGWWPDGLYTAPTDDALRYDVEVTKKLGFNMARKHVKIEPARWYYHCDKLGLLVWQDMPNGNRPDERVGPAATEDWHRDPRSARQFEAELKALIDARGHFPSIVMWVPFNEGWGQYDTERIAAWVKHYDPTRLVNSTSGWADRGVGDVMDVHMYPGPGIEPPGADRAVVLGEFGGLGLPVEGHLWWDKRNWGYRTYETREELRQSYETVVDNLYGLLGLGLSAAVYTQTTDVEGEVNGLMTYDRAIVKHDFAELVALNRRFYGPPPSARVLLASSEFEPQPWRYTFEEPAAGWEQSGFDDSGWKRGDAPLGWPKTAFFPLNTPWKSKDVWLRRTFSVDKLPADLCLKVCHDAASASVYLNGKLVAELSGATRRHYGHMTIGEHTSLVEQGTNTLAVHAMKPRGGRAIDVGLIDVIKGLAE